MYRETRVHVVIPAFNAAATIGAVLRAVPPFVDAITVVDDGSEDVTSSEVEKIGDPRVTLNRHASNRGVGGAMLSGLSIALEAGDGIIVKVDADDQMDLRELPKLLDPIIEGRSDCVKGNRFLHSRQLSSMPFHRRMGNFALTFLTKIASGYWHVFDPQNGYIAWSTPTLRLLDLERVAKGYFFENDMLINLNIFDARVIDVPMPARYGGERSSMSIARVLVSFPTCLVRSGSRRFYEKYILRDFSPIALLVILGMPLFLWGAAFGAWTWLQSWRFDRFASTGTVMLSVLPLVLGFQMLLQAFVLEIGGGRK